MLSKKIATGLFVLACCSANAFAGTSVQGYGDTRAAAVSSAENKARQLAKQKQTCYEFVDASQCTKSTDGGWMCEASVANHQGSCGGSDKIRP